MLQRYNYFGVNGGTINYNIISNIFEAFDIDVSNSFYDGHKLLTDQSFANMLAMHQLAFIENWPDEVKDSFYQGVEPYDEDEEYDPTDEFENELLPEQRASIACNMIDRWIEEFIPEKV